MHLRVPWGDETLHAEKLKRGLAALGPRFLAYVCWSCKGTTRRGGHECEWCGGNYSTPALGLLAGDSKPAGQSVVNQVLNAALHPREETIHRMSVTRTWEANV